MKLTKAIITAMEQEADLIIKRYNLKKVDGDDIPLNLKVFKGERKNIEENSIDEIILILSGIGKIQASFATTYLFENYEITKLVNIGIAGNLNDTGEIKVGDVFLPNTFIQYDMYLPFEGEHLNYAKKPIFLDYAIGENYDLTKFGLLLSGVCLTGDQFIDDKIKAQELRENYSGDIVEMEAFAILSVARTYKALDKCVVIKAVSDGADSESKDAHMDNLEFAMNNSISILDLVL